MILIDLQFFKCSFNGSITNISVIEITDDTNLPRINYEGFSYQDALGSELIVNGDLIQIVIGLKVVVGLLVVVLQIQMAHQVYISNTMYLL